VKVNFRRFKSPSEVKEFLTKQLMLGTATPDDVSAFLDELGLKHSRLHDNSEYHHKVFDASGDPEIHPSPYEQHISSMARARPTLFILANAWMMYFHFNAGTLAEIEVELTSIGL
jgi:hypothetical protein